MNYYDAEIFSEVLKRLEAEKDAVQDRAGYDHVMKPGDAPRAFEAAARMTIRERIRQFSRYHGLSKRDAVFFNQSDLICDMAKREDFIVMGRCADQILTNNRIPHVSIFITAPLEQRIRRIMQIHSEMPLKQVRQTVKKADRQHTRYYHYFTGKKWGDAVNYDLCINSAAYGIHRSVDFILKMLEQ